MDFEYKRLSDERMGDLKKLFEVVFRRNLSLDYLKQKYDNSLNEGKYIANLAYTAEGRPIGFHGVTYYRIRYKNEIIVAGQGGDSMTDPTFQGKGLFTKLGLITQQLAADEGLEFIYGFPNQNSYPGYIKKLDWQFTGEMNCYTIKVGGAGQERIFRRLGLNKLNISAINKHVTPLLAEDRVFESSVVDDEYGGVHRDAHFYDYKRYSDNYILNIEDCKVWVKMHGALLVGDIEDKDEPTKKKVLAELIRLAKKLGLSSVIIQTSPGTHIDQFMKKEHEPLKTFPIGFYNIRSEIPFEKLRFTYGDLDTF